MGGVWMDESYQQRQRSCDTLQSLTDEEMGKKTQSGRREKET